MGMEAAKQGGVAQRHRHPTGLYVLTFTEMWERFSFYGMSALLTLYMVKELLLPANAAQVYGLAAMRGLFEFRGPMSDLAFAAIIYGWYAGLVYFTPIVGGWIADRFLGARRTVMGGVLLMTAGHIAMSFYATFVLALLLLILGSGLLKGNISAQVGKLYPADDVTMRTRGFAIFSTGICIGAASGPLIAGLVAAIYGWHAGFAVAAVMMVLALAVYVFGQGHLPTDVPTERNKAEPIRLSRAERRAVTALICAIALTIPAEIAYPMIWGVGALWLDKYAALGTGFGEVPPTWFASADSIGAIIAAPLLVGFWGWQSRRGREPDSLSKIGIGTAIVCAAALLIALSSRGPIQPDSVHIVWPIIAWPLMGLAWLCYWPTLLALVSRIAPPSISSLMMGVAFLSPFIGHTLMGWVGSYFDSMTPAQFWSLDAAIALGGVALIIVSRRYLAPLLA
jgi:POT family proton-dependent oligopeptide transporter